MPRPRYHVFICVQQRPPGHPRGSCQPRGGAEILQVFVAELQRRDSFDRVSVTQSGCIGPCDSGANVLVYPEGILYGNVRKEDVAEIFQQHFESGVPVDRCASRRRSGPDGPLRAFARAAPHRAADSSVPAFPILVCANTSRPDVRSGERLFPPTLGQRYVSAPKHFG
jgi:(2Fe-2S) ferredoxin